MPADKGPGCVAAFPTYRAEPGSPPRLSGAFFSHMGPCAISDRRAAKEMKRERASNPGFEDLPVPEAVIEHHRRQQLRYAARRRVQRNRAWLPQLGLGLILGMTVLLGGLAIAEVIGSPGPAGFERGSNYPPIDLREIRLRQASRQAGR